MCDPAEQKSVEQKLVGTFGLWVLGTPQFKYKNVRVEQKLCDPVEQKLAEQKLVGTFRLCGTNKRAEQKLCDPVEQK